MATDEIGQGHELPKTQPTLPAMARESAERYLTAVIAFLLSRFVNQFVFIVEIYPTSGGPFPGRTSGKSTAVRAARFT